MLTNKNRAARTFSTVLTLLMALLFTGCQPSGPKSLLLGDKYVRQGEYPKALKYLGRASTLLPERPEVWNLQGLAYHGMQQPGRAAEAYQRALRIDRNFAPAHFNLGALLLEQDRPADAATELNAYLALQPNDDQGWSRLGAALVRNRRTDEADRALAQALKLNPKNAQAHNSLGLVHIQRKRPREAMQSFNSALQYRPGFGAALLNQGIVAQQYFGNTQIAKERYRAFLNSRPDPRSAAEVQAAIRQIELANNPSPAQVPLADLTTNTGIGALLRSNLAQQAERSRTVEMPPAAATQPAVAVSRTNAVTPPQVATVPKTNATPLPAVPAPTLVQTPPPAPTNRTVAAAVPPQIKESSPLPEEETESPLPVERVEINRDPELRVPTDVEASAAMTTSNIPAVTQAASERPLIAPRRKTDDEKRGLLARLKQANPAKWFEHEDTKTLAPVAIPPPAIPQPPVEPAGRVAPPLQRPPVLRYEHHKDMPVTKGNRTLAQKYFAKAAAAHQQRRLPEAISLYRQAIAADPSYFEPSYNLGLAAYQNKDLPLALAANEQAVAVNPTSADARYNFALTLREAHYYTDAANELRQLADMAPNDPRAQLALANLYAQQLDEAALARTHYQRFLELAPNHPEAAIVRQWLGAR